MDTNSQQLFSTCHFDKDKNRDIALEEYKFACKILEQEQKIFDNMVKYIIIFGTLFNSILMGFLDKIFDFFTFEREVTSLVISFLIFILFLFITKDFAHKQKEIVFAKRKIVTLRGMLGINYGNQQLLFRRNEVDGAYRPFDIKLSFSYLFLPIPVLCFISIFLVNAHNGETTESSLIAIVCLVILLSLFKGFYNHSTII
ncbi:hypothetical protein DCO58_12475 [Helicobacter saguini]|uniref:Uncharacterized protein n=1 Tax=Helicobacter saguini TaxID=1548018 RepID=A0A347VQM0_9HELI|nr:hypothetical protein [Helicobacter saguini]MWV60895.1 hypothetical protein [Helicobacter saguini]MWV68437.1 hypothetical protein [Helicobacter saguini]MWV70099.1 hypothetical protein [Helicobacter saguini]MWV72002.1 hypothetical protein [Helicobacter saguini]TLD93771.1 hypothetical protein LS64_008240 [Helicobacter saguini]